MECFTCGKSYTSWEGLAYHKGAVHGITNRTYLTIEKRKRPEKLINDLKGNKEVEHEEVVDELSEVEFQFQGYITGFYHYRHHWTPKIDEKLTISPDKDNLYGVFAVNVIKDEKTTVGHVSMGMTNLLNSGGCITVTDHPVLMKREGMRVPCHNKVSTWYWYTYSH